MTFCLKVALILCTHISLNYVILTYMRFFPQSLIYSRLQQTEFRNLVKIDFQNLESLAPSESRKPISKVSKLSNLDHSYVLISPLKSSYFIPYPLRQRFLRNFSKPPFPWKLSICLFSRTKKITRQVIPGNTH